MLKIQQHWHNICKFIKILFIPLFQIIGILLIEGFLSGCSNSIENCYCDNVRVTKLKLQWRIYFDENGFDINNEDVILSLYQIAHWMRQNPKVRLSVTGNNMPKSYDNDLDRQGARDLRRARVQSVYNIFKAFDEFDKTKTPISDVIDYYYFDETIIMPSQNPKEYMSCDIQVILVDDHNNTPNAKNIISGKPMPRPVEDKKYNRTSYPASQFINLKIP